MALYGTDTYNEWYPIHLIDSNPERGETIELTDDAYAEYRRVMEQFWIWQNRIKKELNLADDG